MEIKKRNYFYMSFPFGSRFLIEKNSKKSPI